jgi:hypothetical protein
MSGGQSNTSQIVEAVLGSHVGVRQVSVVPVASVGP